MSSLRTGTHGRAEDWDQLYHCFLKGVDFSMFTCQYYFHYASKSHLSYCCRLKFSRSLRDYLPRLKLFYNFSASFWWAQISLTISSSFSIISALNLLYHLPSKILNYCSSASALFRTSLKVMKISATLYKSVHYSLFIRTENYRWRYPSRTSSFRVQSSANISNFISIFIILVPIEERIGTDCQIRDSREEGLFVPKYPDVMEKNISKLYQRLIVEKNL